MTEIKTAMSKGQAAKQILPVQEVRRRVARLNVRGEVDRADQLIDEQIALYDEERQRLLEIKARRRGGSDET